MLDIKFIRENKDLIEAGAKKKHLKFDVNELLIVDDKRKELLLLTENKKAEQGLHPLRFSLVNNFLLILF